MAWLAVIIATGYRRVFCVWRSNVSTGSLLLAYFYMGLVYNFTEAAFFKMLAPAWIFFLFAITSVPEVSYPKVPEVSDSDRSGNGGAFNLPETRSADHAEKYSPSKQLVGVRG